MKKRWRVILELQLENVPHPYATLHAVLTEKIADGTTISGITVVDVYPTPAHLNVSRPAKLLGTK